MDDIEWIIARLRGEFAMITYPGAANAERSKFKKRNFTNVKLVESAAV